MDFQANSVTDPATGAMNVCVVLQNDGEEIIKTIPLYAFAKMIGSNLLPVQKDVSLRLGRLPQGFVDCNISDQKNFTILIEAPAMKRNFYYSKTLYKIPFPRLLFKYVVSKGIVIKKYCCAVKEDANLYCDFEVYRYPFGNVNSLGDICFGNIHLVDISALSDMDYVMESFFESETNNDYYYAGQSVTPSFTQLQLIKELEKQSLFPEEWLAKADCSPSLFTV